MSQTMNEPDGGQLTSADCRHWHWISEEPGVSVGADFSDWLRVRWDDADSDRIASALRNLANQLQDII